MKYYGPIAEDNARMPAMRDSPRLSPAPKGLSLRDSLLRAVLDASPLPMWVEVSMAVRRAPDSFRT